MDIDRLYWTCGKTLDYCQRIEHDLRLLLSILSAWRNIPLEDKERLTLGQAIVNLEAIDKESERPYLAKQDYLLLRSLRNRRNDLVHDCFQRFLYAKEEERLARFEESLRRVERTKNEFESLWKSLEDARIEAYEAYRRSMEKDERKAPRP